MSPLLAEIKRSGIDRVDELCLSGTGSAGLSRIAIDFQSTSCAAA